MAEFYFDLPTETPLENINPYVELLLGAIDDYLALPQNWREEDRPYVDGWLEELKLYLLNLENE